MSTNLPRPARSPGTSPRRRPLHERSKSSTNEAVLPDSSVFDDDYVYSSNPFPQHPSQILQPSARSFFFFEDDPQSSTENPIAPLKSSRRSHESISPSQSGSPRKKSSSPKLRGKGKKRLRRKSEIGVDGSAVRLDTPDLVPPPLSPDKRMPEQDETQEAPQPFRADPGPSILPEERTRLQPPRDTWDQPPESSAAHPFSIPSTSQQGNSSPPYDSGRQPPPIWSTFPMRQKGLQRLRSQSSELSTLTAGGTKYATEPGRPSDDRPRSASSPTEPTDAFLQALIDQGVNVQYPKLKQPSATSLRSQSSSVKAAYPPPLTLHRKRANSQLARAASGAPYQSSFQDTAFASGIRASPNAGQPSLVSTTVRATTDTALPIKQRDVERNDPRASGRWTDEMDDTITELNPPPLRQQRSGHTTRQSSTSDSRPGTSESSNTSQKGSLYRFLNDSYTSWAKVFYQNEDRLPLETPPHVTNNQLYIPPSTPVAQRQRSTTTNTSSVSGPSQSPGSAEFPEAIYVPRVRPLLRRSNSPSPPEPSYNIFIPRTRPLQRQHRDHHDHDNETHDTQRQATRQPSTDSLAITPALDQEQPVQPSDSSAPEIPKRSPDRPTFPDDGRRSNPLIWQQPFNPTQMVPHLSPDKRSSILYALDTPRNFTAPSFDEHQSAFSRTNRQIVLFCIGFVMPFAWMLAAVLPIPPRPSWRKSTMGGKITPVDEFEEKTGRGVVDLYDSLDVQRWSRARWWRNLNRFMSIVGVIIIATLVVCVVVGTKSYGPDGQVGGY